MPTYAYIAIDAQTGKELRGSCQAGTAAQATAELKAQGLYPTDLDPVQRTDEDSAAVAGSGAKPSRKRTLRRRGGAGRSVRTLFTRQLATMLKAGMPLLRALEVLERQQAPGRFREAVASLAESIRGGGMLSDGLRRFPRLFDRLTINMVKAGEASGALDVVLLRLADFMEKSQRIRGKLWAAMTYPVIIMLVAGLVVLALVLFVVPQFESIFATMLKGRPLPLLTQMVVNSSNFILNNLLIVVLGLIAGAGGLVWLSVSERGKTFLDRVKLMTPVLGDLVLKTAVARFTRTLGTLLNSGVPILDALQITAETAGNSKVADAVRAVRERVKAGEGVAKPLEATGVFPDMVPSMIEVGEETGQLPDMLERVADTFEEEVDNAVTALTSILEPVMIVIMAVVVGTIVIALFLPLVSIVQTLS